MKTQSEDMSANLFDSVIASTVPSDRAGGQGEVLDKAGKRGTSPRVDEIDTAVIDLATVSSLTTSAVS